MTNTTITTISFACSSRRASASLPPAVSPFSASLSRRACFRAASVLLLAQCLGLAAWAARLPVTTTLTVSTASGPVTTVAAKTVVTLTAAVAGGGPGGQVTFCDATAPSCSDIHLLGTAAVTSLGAATMKFVPGIGLHAYKAVYLGTTQNAGSTSDVAKLAVTGSYPTATSLALSGTVGNYGLTATVVGNGLSAPSGPVSFLDASKGNGVLGTAMLGMPSASLSFANVANPAVGNSPYTIRSADLNGDGIPDLVTANSGAPGVTVLLGNGDGTFTQKTGSAFPLYSYFVVIADLNGDGIPDLVTSNPFQFTVNVLLGNGDGTFRQGQAIPDSVYPYALATGDFNGDGIPDLVIGDANNHPMTIWMGRGDGTFGNPTSLGPNLSVWSIATGDFNGDGIVDVIATMGGTVLEFLGNGDGTFITKTVPGFSAVGGNPTIQVADFNRDGILDLALTGSSGGQVALGKGDGTFMPGASVQAGPPNFFSAGTIGDFNGDGIADLAVADLENQVVVALGKGDGTFTLLHSAQKGSFNSVASADFDGDGLADLAVSSGYTNTVTSLLAQGGATATASVTGISPLGTGAHAVKASYAGDANYGGSVSSAVSLTAAQAATTLTLSAAPAGGSRYGQQVALMATLTPSAGQANTTDGETVFFHSGPAVVGLARLSNGMATLNLTTLPRGVDSLTASYAGDAIFKPSDSAPLRYVVDGLVPRIVFKVADRVYSPTPFAVNATSNSPGAITYSVVSGAATIAGNVVTLKSRGPVVLLASQAAAGEYAAGTQTAAFIVLFPTRLTFQLLSTNLLHGQPTTFEVQISLDGNDAPSGSVQILDDSRVAGRYPIYPSLVGNVKGLTPRLTVGQHTLVARYRGDTNYGPAVSAPVTVTVSAAGNQ